MVSLALSQLLTEKKYQYAKLPVKFNYELDQAGHFAFIETEPVAFERMLSNLINNAVEAFEGKPGKVNLTVNADNSLLKIIIEDNGKGIPPKVLDKIRKNIAVTSGKESGKGIGLVQVRETLQRNNVEFVIESKVGKGTKITLTFLRTVPPEWIADEICVNRGDIVVILDDDPSIHGAWEARFEQYGGAVKLQHFTFGEDAVAFSNAADKDKIFLLADFELLKQKLNGIDVIKRTKIQRSILVTSHFNDRTVRDLASKSNIKILPKQLALKVTIEIANLATKTAAVSDTAYKNVDVVVIEDHKILADNLAVSLEGDSDRIVDVYYDGSKFLKKFMQYSKDTKFCIDYSLGGKVTGLEIAKKLYEVGYTKLFLTSGWEFDSGEVPDYVTIVKKRDIQDIIKALE